MNKLYVLTLFISLYSLTGCGGASDAPEPAPPVPDLADTTPPVITLTPGNTTYDLLVGDDIPEITVTATDDKDGDISDQVVI